jgi:hypothetical protein
MAVQVVVGEDGHHLTIMEQGQLLTQQAAHIQSST